MPILNFTRIQIQIPAALHTPTGDTHWVITEAGGLTHGERAGNSTPEMTDQVK